MVKGISRQVIVVQSPDPKLFEQAIFILRDEAVGKEGITNEALLKEAKKLIQNKMVHKKRAKSFSGPLWACGGACVTGLIWLLSALM